jgi:hypothetical protein
MLLVTRHGGRVGRHTTAHDTPTGGGVDCALTRSLTHRLTHSRTFHAIVPARLLCTYISLTRPFIATFTYSLTHSLTHPPTCSLALHMLVPTLQPLAASQAMTSTIVTNANVSLIGDGLQHSDAINQRFLNHAVFQVRARALNARLTAGSHADKQI